MIDWFILLRGMSLGVLVAMMLALALTFRHIYALRILAIFALCLCGYMLAPVLYGVNAGFYLAVALSEASTLMFLLLCQALFDEHQKPHRGTVVFGAVFLAISYTEIILRHALGFDTGWLFAALRITQTAIALAALYVVGRNWRADLVEARRRLRWIVIVVAGMYVLTITVAESVVGGGQIPAWVEIANSAGMLLSILIFVAAALSLGTSGLLPTAPVETPAPEYSDPELSRIVASMEQEHVYRDMELTIRSLAEQLGIAEHRLRRVINKQLEYRNFNDFLNHYRLAEICARLADPGQAHTPILTIAMDAGYKSMTTFNRAFRTLYGQTPTDFRQKHLPISEKS